jgi:Carboxypeptidase regulatory-like domain
MFRKFLFIAFAGSLLMMRSPAQTTNGLFTGTVTDSSGAVVPQAEVDVTNQGTSQLRTATTDNTGSYIVPQLPPGIYDVSIKKQGFATENQANVQLQVNQSATLNFQLSISAAAQTVNVTGVAAELNTTSATIGNVIGHEEAVDLPLNGREFTQLALLTPGAAPIEQSQQSAFTVSLGAGGISPAVNGQSGYENNFTMDGVLNNALFTNVWMISPPPDALQEFNVQSHITDAQFGISSGANINIATRAGTNTFHGAGWEFARNSAMDARNYFDQTRLPYSQNQYGVYLGGPVRLPRFNGKDNTWFSGYWEGFRASQNLTYFASTLTSAMRNGDFSAVLGPQVGVDSLGRPEYQNEIYDPATSRPSPTNPAVVLRDPFPGNIIPQNRISPTAPLILAKYYPLPNLNVAPGVLPNLSFVGGNTTASDVTGIRIDHQFKNNDSVFGRYNRANINQNTPEPTPGYVHTTTNYAQTVAAGYTHLFGARTILNLRYAWSNMSLLYNDEQAGVAFNNSIGFSLTGNAWGPNVSMANGYSGTSQTQLPLGPQWTNEFHADLSKTVGNHTLGVGGMYYHIHSFDGVTSVSTSFTQNATSQGATPGPTGYGPATFMMGLVESIGGYTGSGLSQDAYVNWWAGYVQDQWKATQRLTVTAGLRWDFVSPPSFSDAVSGLDVATGQFLITQPFLPLFPKATGPSGFYYAQYNGFEPRVGFVYQAAPRTVVRAAFAIMDDHNHSLVQEDQNLRLSWPNAVTISVSQQNQGLPTLYLNNLPTAGSFVDPLHVYVGSSSNPHNSIPYAMEYNLGVEQQLSNSTMLDLDYVGSLDRHQSINPSANTATIPGPGTLVSRGQPYPQYGGGAIGYEENAGSGSYNALQAEIKRSFSAGLAFTASYTWSKSMDIQSDVYGASGPQNFYDLKADWGPSNYDLRNLFVFSGVYALPIGRGRAFLSTPNRFVEGLAGNWNIGGIVSLHSGQPLECTAGGDIANVGGGTQRCNQIGSPYGGANTGFQQTKTSWLNPAAFNTIPYTFGDERRNNLVGPSYKDVDFSAFKDFPLTERVKLQFRAEFFNVLNHTNFSLPNDNLQAGTAFGQIFGSSFARQSQFAAKFIF